MATPPNMKNFDEALELIHDILSRDFKDGYVTHSLTCENIDRLVEYVTRLSFTKGNCLENLWSPPNMRVVAVKFQDYVWITIGGHPTIDETYEIRTTAKNMKIEIQSTAIGDKGQAHWDDFVKALKKEQSETACNDTTPGTGLPTLTCVCPIELPQTFVEMETGERVTTVSTLAKRCIEKTIANYPAINRSITHEGKDKVTITLVFDRTRFDESKSKEIARSLITNWNYFARRALEQLLLMCPGNTLCVRISETIPCH